jgi:polysaccharide export outer membrane protein
MSSEAETPLASADIVYEPEEADAYVQSAATSMPGAAATGDPTPYLLDTGDRVRVFVYGQPNLTRTYPVDGAGFIAMPLIGSVKARGLTTYDLGANIATLLGTDYVRDPQVAVEVVSYRPVFVIGEVRNAGQFAFQPGMTVETAVAVAGGYTARASQQTFEVTRTVGGEPMQIEVSRFERVRPGDTIRVHERFF